MRLLQVLTEAKYKGNAADVWSLGVMLYVMIEGQFPFRPKRQRYQMQKLIGRIVNAEYKRCTHVRHWHQELTCLPHYPNENELYIAGQLLLCQ